jgi:hypothetical protein
MPARAGNTLGKRFPGRGDEIVRDVARTTGSFLLKPIFFSTAAAFRAWLAANHAKATELLVGLHKVGTGKPSLTWSEAVDQALCFGWIDGMRRSLGPAGYTIRFTPRRARSIRAPHAGPGQRRRRSRVPAAKRGAFGRLQLRAAEAGALARRAGAGVSRRRGGVGVLPSAPALVPANRDLLGGQRQEA